MTIERLGFEGHWFPIPDFPTQGDPLELTPLTPGASRPVSPSSYFVSDRTFSAGTWRAIVDYRDPRHPAFPSYAEATFDVVGLSPAQAEAMLAVVADPADRACQWLFGFVEDFANTAPLAMLPRLLELPEETIDERERALVAITSATHDETLLRRALQEDGPSVRLSAARAVARALAHTSTQDNNLLWLLSTMEILPRVMADAPIEVADVRALFALYAGWPPELIQRVLQRLADPHAREVSVALALHVAASADRFTHADLVRIRQVLVRTVAQVTDPGARALYQTAIRDCTVAVNGRPGAVRYLTDSSLAAVGLRHHRAPEGCRPDYEAFRTMSDFARHPERMRFIPRVEVRRTSASSAP